MTRKEFFTGRGAIIAVTFSCISAMAIRNLPVAASARQKRQFVGHWMILDDFSGSALSS
jgi:hypothetical protein